MSAKKLSLEFYNFDEVLSFSHDCCMHFLHHFFIDFMLIIILNLICYLFIPVSYTHLDVYKRQIVGQTVSHM